MADTVDAAASQPASSGKKKSSAKPKKPKTSPAHPKVSEMVTEAITELKERGGSSLQAIKKHVASSYKVDVEKLSPFIKKYLKNAVASGALVQTKGKGATGSFRLSASSGKPKETTAKAKKAPSTPKKKVKATPAKKVVAKPKAVKKPAAAAKKAKPKAAKSPAKKAKATKPKTPKPKKAKAPAKKAAAKKGKK